MQAYEGSRGSSRWSGPGTLILWSTTTIAIPLALYMAFLYAPDERVMGAAQRIFYFHVPAAFVTFFGAVTIFASAVAMLTTRAPRWDHWTLATTEVSWVFCTIVLLTGPIWAKAAWKGRVGDWIFDPKLATTAILWLLLTGALLVRRAAASEELGARLGAVLGILAAVDVPIVHKATVWWRGHHPVLFAPGKRDALDPRMRLAFLICTIVFFLLFGLLVALRRQLAEVEHRARAAAERASNEGRS